MIDRLDDFCCRRVHITGYQHPPRENYCRVARYEGDQSGGGLLEENGTERRGVTKPRAFKGYWQRQSDL